jgi:plasmid stabilization system protein ParE
MNFSLVVQPEAEADLAEAKAWYERQGKGLANEFRVGIEEAFERILRMPELHAEIYKGIRRSRLRRFPYAIFYRLEETRVVVLAVMHNRRDPNRWRSRA